MNDTRKILRDFGHNGFSQYDDLYFTACMCDDSDRLRNHISVSFTFNFSLNYVNHKNNEPYRDRCCYSTVFFFASALLVLNVGSRKVTNKPKKNFILTHAQRKCFMAKHYDFLFWSQKMDFFPQFPD